MRHTIPLPIAEAQVRAALDAMSPKHPRLIATPERIATLKNAPPESSAGRFAAAIVQRAAQVLDTSPVVYEKEGRRLLGVSREALRRLTLLGVAWFRSGDDCFVRRAEAEIEAVCAFPDWNPSHYLDTAEMALAVALAYDWMYDALKPAVRNSARQGLIRHAFESAFPAGDHGWPVATNNWGQVCHAGVTAAALALYEDQPDTAFSILHRAVNNVQLAATCYSPDGVYPEGPIYWDYGTSFHVMLLEMLRTAVGCDFGLNALPGFMASADVVLHLTTPAGRLYGFADGSSSPRLLTTLLWFAAEGATTLPADAPEQLDEKGLTLRGRLDPLAAFWIDKAVDPGQKSAELPLDFVGRGTQPVATFRGAWGNPDAWFLGIKGGSPSGPHGHMDGGSFILEAHGQRWVADLGADNYHRIESRGMNLWDQAQDGDRWRVFRLGTTAHSVIQIDDHPQAVKGEAKLVEWNQDGDCPACRWNLTSLYPRAAKVERRFEFPERHSLRVKDHIEGLAADSRVAWSFATEATVELDPDAPAALTLRQAGHALRVTAKSNRPGAWHVTPADSLLQAHDTPLPGTTIVCFETAPLADGELDLEVAFRPRG